MWTRGRPVRRLLIVLAATLALPSAAGAQAPSGPEFLQPSFLDGIDDAQIHGTITPPGADTRHATAELRAYDSLVQAYPTLTADRLEDFFKVRRFGQRTEGERTYRPRAGVTVVRDGRWGEPAIYGATDEDMAFGAGFVGAEDRLAIMELLRALGRAEAFELLGTSQAWLADAEIARLYGYTEEEFAAMAQRLPQRYGKAGADVLRILDSYVAGINEYIALGVRGEVPLPAGLADLGIVSPAPWKRTDVVAVVSIVRALFGAGGGSELANATILAQLSKELGPEVGRRAYEDLRNRDNLDGTVHTTRRFPYALRDAAKLDPAANVLGVTSGADGISGGLGELLPQLRSLRDQARVKHERLKLSTPLGALDLSRPGRMSNHLVVGAGRSATGRPIILGGPQAGYFSPQILMDYELHSPTIHARGAGFPGLSTLVVLGRTQDYAWTATAGASDMIDTYVEKLCNPDGSPPTEQSRHYVFEGSCEPMDRRTYRTAALYPGTVPPGLPDIIVERTVHGPVVARGTLGDVPVAVSRKRSTYGKELDPAVSILKLNRNEARTGKDFVRIFHESHNLSTNWSYANDHEIAYVHGGLYPRRPAVADPDLPVWGTGEWEWKKDERGEDAYLSSAEVPHEVSPRRDLLSSWNNRPAPGWGASDAQWGWGSLHRGRLVEEAITGEPKGTITPTRLVQVMEHAGLTDLRGRYVAPLVLRLLEERDDLGARDRRMLELLRTWAAEGALRRDGDGDGRYDRASAVAIMDALWEPLIRAIFTPVIGDPARIPLQFDNAPNSAGSAYETGFYGQVHSDLKRALGDPLRSPMSRIYCGGTPDAAGSRGACSDRVLQALREAGDALAAKTDPPADDPDAWEADAGAERIQFLPAAVLTMHWVNRPTTQGLTMFGRLGRTPVGGACLKRRAFASVGTTPKGRAVTVRVVPRDGARVSVDLLRVGSERRPVRPAVRVRSFGRRTRSFTFTDARLRDGWYVLRFRGLEADGTRAVRRLALRRLGGRFHRVHAIERRRACGALSTVTAGSPVFGGRRPFAITLRLTERARVSLEVRRGGKLVRRARARTLGPGLHTVRFAVRGLRRGDHDVAVKVAGTRTLRLRARRL